MAEDYYDVLGVARGADDGDIKKAYRRLAMKYHPDRGEGDAADNEENFKKVNEAYAVLSDKEKRNVYDQYGKEGLQGQFGSSDFSFNGRGFEDVFGGFDDIFQSVFGGRGRSTRRRSMGEPGEDLEYELDVSLEQAASGDSVEIDVNAMRHCDDCQGSGAAPGTSRQTCPVCDGTGQQSINRGFLHVATTCGQCQGEGEIMQSPCTTCNGRARLPKSKKLSVSIPAGIDDGMRLKLRGEGADGVRGGPVGDLYIRFTVRPHAIFARDGRNLHCRVPISFTQAALGTELEVPSLDGKLRIKVPEGTQSGREFRLRGKGMPGIQGRERQGDLICQVLVETPVSLSSHQKELLNEFEQSLEEKPSKHNPNHHSWFEKLKGYLNGEAS